MSLKWSIADYKDAYLEEIQGLFEETFHISRSKEFLTWENESNPSGKSIIKLALEEGRVIGHTCLWMFKLKLFENTIQAAQSIDAMVKKDRRGRGVYEDIAMDAIGTAVGEGAKIRFNFPNDLAYQASIGKINIKKVCHIPQYLKVLNGYTSATMFVGNKAAAWSAGVVLSTATKLKERKFATNSVKIRELKCFTSEFDQLWQEESRSFSIAVVRDSRHLNWRYISSPVSYICLGAYSSSNVLVGYIVLAVEQKKSKNGSVVKLGHIADILCKNGEEEALAEMLRYAESRLKQEGACAVSCWMLNHSFYTGVLSRMGYLQLKKPAVLAALALAPEVQELGNPVYDENNWYVTIGDSDYV